MQLQQLIEKHWYKKNNLWLCILLLPLSLVFYCVSKFRAYLYQSGIFKSYKLPVPVVIIGNISVGGAGKTPLTKHLAHELSAKGISVGVILRGYKSETKLATVVKGTDDSVKVGDEALIYANSGIRVAIGINRYQAGLALLKQYPDIQIVLADDGMQHYRLQRDYEIAVIDSSRMLGNRFILPMGPLRETAARLKQVNAVVFNGKIPLHINRYLNLPGLVVEQTLVLDKIYNPETNQNVSVSDLRQSKVAALAGIGNPQRFFDFISGLGIKAEKKLAFPDHYHYTAEDIPNDYPIILVTEKDYAKISKLKNAKIWVVLVKTNLSNPELLTQITRLIADTHV